MSKVNKSKESLLDLGYLLTQLDYDAKSGIFTWKVSRRGVKKGKQAGSIKVDGYRKIRLNKQEYLEHRLAWFYIYKEWPKDIIDGNKLNNSINNLRESSTRYNGFNRQDSSKYGHNIICSGINFYIQIQFKSKIYKFGLFNKDKATEYRDWLLEYIKIFDDIPKNNRELMEFIKVYRE